MGLAASGVCHNGKCTDPSDPKIHVRFQVKANQLVSAVTTTTWTGTCTQRESTSETTEPINGAHCNSQRDPDCDNGTGSASRTLICTNGYGSKQTVNIEGVCRQGLTDEEKKFVSLTPSRV